MSFSGRVEAMITVPAGVSVSATNSGGGPSSVTVPAGNYYYTAAGGISSLLTVLAAELDEWRAPSSGSWTVTMSTTTGLVTINCTGTWSLTWTNTVLRDILGFTADISGASSAQTGTKQAKALWIPNAPLNMDGDTERAPRVTDKKDSMGPTGNVLSLVGNSYRRHTGLYWGYVPLANTWEDQVTYANGSWETFVNDTQFGLGSISWFTPGMPVQIYDNSDLLVGSDATITGWKIIGLNSTEPRKSAPPWNGYWRIELPQIVAATA